MTDTVRDVVIRVRVEQAKNRGSAVEVDTKPAEKGLDALAKKSKEVTDQLKKSSDEQKRLLENSAVKSVNKLMEEVSTEKARQEYLKFGSAMKATGEGAFILARGLALATSASDEQLAAMIKNVAVVQGYFDIYKGAFEVTKGVTESMVALKAATGATTVVQAVQIATVAALQKGYLALYAAMGPIGLAAGAIGVAVAAAGAIWAAYSASQENATRKMLENTYQQQRAVEALRDAHRLLLAEYQRGQLDSAFNRGNTMFGLADRRNQSTGSQLSDIARKQLDDRRLSLASIGQNPLLKQAYQGEALGLAYTPGGVSESIKNTPGLIKDDARFMEMLNRGANAMQKFNPQIDWNQINKELGVNSRGQAGREDIYAREQERLEQQKAAMMEYGNTLKSIFEQEKQSQQAKLKLLDDQLGATRKLLEAENERMNAIKEAIQAEKNRTLTLTQQFGALSKPEQQQLIGLGEKVKAGGIDSLNPGELARLRGSGFADSLISRRDLASGQAAGADNLFKNLGTMLPNAVQVAGGANPMQTLQEMLEQQAKGNRDEVDRLSKILDQGEEARAMLLEKIRDIVESDLDIADAIAELAAFFKKIDQNLGNLKNQVQKMDKDQLESQTFGRNSMGSY